MDECHPSDGWICCNRNGIILGWIGKKRSRAKEEGTPKRWIFTLNCTILLQLQLQRSKRHHGKRWTEPHYYCKIVCECVCGTGTEAFIWVHPWLRFTTFVFVFFSFLLKNSYFRCRDYFCMSADCSFVRHDIIEDHWCIHLAFIAGWLHVFLECSSINLIRFYFIFFYSFAIMIPPWHCLHVCCCCSSSVRLYNFWLPFSHRQFKCGNLSSCQSNSFRFQALKSICCCCCFFSWLAINEACVDFQKTHKFQNGWSVREFNL